MGWWEGGSFQAGFNIYVDRQHPGPASIIIIYKKDLTLCRNVNIQSHIKYWKNPALWQYLAMETSHPPFLPTSSASFHSRDHGNHQIFKQGHPKHSNERGVSTTVIAHMLRSVDVCVTTIFITTNFACFSYCPSFACHAALCVPGCFLWDKPG